MFDTYNTQGKKTFLKGNNIIDIIIIHYPN